MLIGNAGYCSYLAFLSTDPSLLLIKGVDNLMLMRFIDEEFLRIRFFGSRKMKVYLNRRGFPVNRKLIQRLMCLMCLDLIAPKPNTSK